MWAVVSVLLGLLVADGGFFALLACIDAHNARTTANRAAAKAAFAAVDEDQVGVLKVGDVHGTMSH